MATPKEPFRQHRAQAQQYGRQQRRRQQRLPCCRCYASASGGLQMPLHSSSLLSLAVLACLLATSNYLTSIHSKGCDIMWRHCRVCLVMLQHKSLLLRPTKCQGPALAPPLLLSPWIHLYTAGAWRRSTTWTATGQAHGHRTPAGSGGRRSPSTWPPPPITRFPHFAPPSRVPISRS